MSQIGPRNPAVQHLRRLSRRRRARLEAGAFVIDGPVLIGDALDADVELDAVYVEPRALAEPWAGALLERCAAVGVRRLDVVDGTLASATDTVTPPPIAAIGRVRTRPLRFFTSSAAGLVVVLAGVADPGNAGTILRSAEAAGAKGVVVTPSSVDLHSPKVVRASAGSIFRVPVAEAEGDAVSLVTTLAASGFAVLGTVADGGTEYDRVDLTGPTAVVLGNEAHGLDPEVRAALTGLLTIPMAGATESLNVAMAATVICFEAARQRRSR